MAQGKHYTDHVMAMTAEGLHAKSAIAAELAHRDIEIERLRAAVKTLGGTLAWQCFGATISVRDFDDEVPMEPREAMELAAAALRA